MLITLLGTPWPVSAVVASLSVDCCSTRLGRGGVSVERRVRSVSHCSLLTPLRSSSSASLVSLTLLGRLPQLTEVCLLLLRIGAGEAGAGVRGVRVSQILISQELISRALILEHCLSDEVLQLDAADLKHDVEMR